MNEPRNIRLCVAYDGTDFSGWQRQIDTSAGERRIGLPRTSNLPSAVSASFTPVPLRTVQGCIENALEKLHKHPVTLTAAGRTDSGVHATGQVVNFYTDIRNIAPERFVPALNGLLPQDVRILEAAETNPDFHARFDAKARTYQYHIIAGGQALPHELRYSLQLWRQPCLKTLNAYARLLRGEMDCGTFATPKLIDESRTESRFRYIFNAGFFMQNNILVFEITANAFLWKMVRSIVGTLLHYEEKHLSPKNFDAIIKSADRTKAGPSAPPKGLFLRKVDYYK